MDANPYQAPQAGLEAKTVFCRQCGTRISPQATTCPACQGEQALNSKSKVAAGLLAIFFGAFGVHRLYLGQWWGLLYLVLFWTWIPGLIALVEGIVFLCTSDSKWLAKYGNTKGGGGLVAAVVVGVVGVALIGILAAIAIPAYNDYSKRAEQIRLEQGR